jgi:hypothetical protein
MASGPGTGPSEAFGQWPSPFRTELASRGPKAGGPDGVKPVISGAHTGPKAAIARVFDATRRRCRVHRIRDASVHVPRSRHTVVAAAIRQALGRPDREQAGQTCRRVADRLRGRRPKLAGLMGGAEEEGAAPSRSGGSAAAKRPPAVPRPAPHSTDPFGRLDEEAKRRICRHHPGR